MADDGQRARRMLRGGAGLLIGANVGFWLLLYRASIVGWLICAAGLIVAGWLATGRRARWRGISLAVQVILVGAVLRGLHSVIEVGDRSGRWHGQPMATRALLFLSVFISLYALVLLARDLLPHHCGVLRLWLRIGPPARRAVYLLVFVVLAVGSAEFFTIGMGRSKFDYRIAKHHPLFAYRLPNTYTYAHAQERFVRDVGGFRFQQKKPEGVLRVVLNGASTMAGAGLRKKHGPQAVLQRLLTERLEGQQVEVILLAVSGKYQVNELIDSVVTLRHWDPNLVISFNGYNELNFGEAGSYYEGMPYSERDVDQVLGTPLTLGWFYGHTHLGAALWEKRWLSPWPIQMYLREPLVYEPPRYFSYLEGTARNLADAGIPYVYAFCPNVFAWRDRRGDGEINEAAAGALEKMRWTLDNPELPDNDRPRRARATQIVAAEGQIPYPIMDLFADSADYEEIFLDDAHFTRTGVNVVMDDLALRIPVWLEQWQPPQKKSRGRSRGTP